MLKLESVVRQFRAKKLVFSEKFPQVAELSQAALAKVQQIKKVTAKKKVEPAKGFLAEDFQMADTEENIDNAIDASGADAPDSPMLLADASGTQAVSKRPATAKKELSKHLTPEALKIADFGILAAIGGAVLVGAGTSSSSSKTTPNTNVTPVINFVGGTTVFNSKNSATIRGNTTGTAYVVSSKMTAPTKASDFTADQGNLWNAVAISTASSNVSISLSGLDDGTYHLYMLSSTGKFSKISTGTITLDSTPPKPTLVGSSLSTANSAYSVGAKVLVQSDSASTLYLVKKTVSITSASSFAKIKDSQANSIAVSDNKLVQLSLSGLEDGAYVLYALDSAGNYAQDTEHTITVSQNALTAVLNSSGRFNNDAGMYIRVQSSQVGTAYLVRDTINVKSIGSITGGDPSFWNSLAITNANVDVQFSLANLAEGTYYLYVADAQGNLSTPTSNNIYIDNTAPTVKITDSSKLFNSKATLTFEGNEIGTAYIVDANLIPRWDPATGSIVLRDAVGAVVTNDSKWNSASYSNTGYGASMALSGLDEGTYRVYLRDTAGNVSNASATTVVIDNTAPTSILSSDGEMANTASVLVKSSELGTAYLVSTTINVNTVSSITSASDNSQNSVAITEINKDTTLALTGLNDGVYRLYTVDKAGNLSSVSSKEITIKSTSATPMLVSTGKFNSNASVTVQTNKTGTVYLVHKDYALATVDKGGTTVLKTATDTIIPEDKWNTVDVPSDKLSTNTTLSLNGLAEGDYYLYAYDSALRKVSSKTVSFVTVDNTAPVETLNRGSNLSISSSGNVFVKSTEAGTAYLVRVQDDTGTNIITVNGDVTKITGATDGNDWNSVSVIEGIETSLSLSSLNSGTYRLYTVDTAGNMTDASSNTVIISSTALTAVLSSTGTLGGKKSTNNTAKASSNTGTGKLFLVKSDITPLAFDGQNLYSDTGKQNLIADSYWSGQDYTSTNQVDISLTGLNSGEYRVYAYDTARSIFSPPTANTVTIDNTGPQLTLSTTDTTGLNSSQSLTVKSSETGIALIVKKGITISDSVFDSSNNLLDASGNKVADADFNQISISATDTDTVLSLSGLSDGDYSLFSLDSLNNLSAPVNNISITSAKKSYELKTADNTALGFLIAPKSFVNSSGQIETWYAWSKDNDGTADKIAFNKGSATDIDLTDLGFWDTNSTNDWQLGTAQTVTFKVGTETVHITLGRGTATHQPTGSGADSPITYELGELWRYGNGTDTKDNWTKDLPWASTVNNDPAWYWSSQTAGDNAHHSVIKISDGFISNSIGQDDLAQAYAIFRVVTG